MLFARLCNTVGLVEPKRRHSWGSEIEYRLPEPQLIGDDDDEDGDVDDDLRTYSEDEDDVNSDKEEYLLGLDLIASCHDVITPLTPSSSSSDEEEEEEEEDVESRERTVTQSRSEHPSCAARYFSSTMGQGSSSASLHRPKLSLTWVLRNGSERKHMVASPEPPIKFQYSKTRRKSSESIKKTNNSNIEFISGKSDALLQKIAIQDDSLKKCDFTSLADVRTVKSVENLCENVNNLKEKSGSLRETVNRKKSRRRNNCKDECDTGTCLQTMVNCGETNSVCDDVASEDKSLHRLTRMCPDRNSSNSSRVKKSDLKRIKNTCVPNIYQQSVEVKRNVLNDYSQDQLSSSNTNSVHLGSNKVSVSTNGNVSEHTNLSNISNYYQNNVNQKTHSVKSIQTSFDEEDYENNSIRNQIQIQKRIPGATNIVNNFDHVATNSRNDENQNTKESEFISKSVGDLRKISGEIANAKHSKTREYLYKIHSKKTNQNYIKTITKDSNIHSSNSTNEKQSKIENIYKFTDNTRYQNKINSASETYNSINNDSHYKNVVTNKEENMLMSRKRTTSEPTLNTSSHRSRERHRQKRRSRSKMERKLSQFGYDIEDVDAFLTKASLDKPANIPVVLSFPTVLYQTYYNGCQDEIPLPLGMVVNAIFKKESWLYVQTPHAEEGYVNYTACLPLGIIPQAEGSNKISPCWETSTDVFPRPCGNMTDSEKLSRSECGGVRCKKKSRQPSISSCGERSVDRLYLRAAANAKTNRREKRQTLLVVDSNYNGRRKNTISVAAGDVVALLSAHLKDWFWVRARDGSEGFIPAKITGHGYF